MNPHSPTEDMTEENSLHIYGTPGNPFDDTMLGGEDVDTINDVLQAAFEAGQTSVDQPAVKIADYKGRSVYEQKAADQIRISIDDKGRAYVKLIVRECDPGMGLIALAGGFKDEGETDHETAEREENEEAKSDHGTLIEQFEIARHPVKGDVRVWCRPDREDGVKKGDIIAMTTAAIIPVVKNAHSHVEAGDDAINAGWVALADLHDARIFGIKGHADMLLEAVKLAGLADQLPNAFTQSLTTRTNNIAVGNDGQQEAAKATLEL